MRISDTLQAIQHGSVQFYCPRLYSNLSSRLYSNLSLRQLCGYDAEEMIPKIPVLPISYADVYPLLKQLVSPPGKSPPMDFQGALRVAGKLTDQARSL